MSLLCICGHCLSPLTLLCLFSLDLGTQFRVESMLGKDAQHACPIWPGYVLSCWAPHSTPSISFNMKFDSYESHNSLLWVFDLSVVL